MTGEGRLFCRADRAVLAIAVSNPHPVEIVLYHTLRRLPEPESTHRFC